MLAHASHQRRHSAQLVARRPVPQVQPYLLPPAGQVPHAPPYLPSQQQAPLQNIQPPGKCSTEPFISSWRIQTSLEALSLSQPQPPPEIVREGSLTRPISTLREASDAFDIQRFSEICRAINWRARPPADFVQAIELALKTGSLMTARQLAEEGARYHPTAEELRKYARVLATPKLLRANLPADLGPRADLIWFREHSASYRGKWVALRHGTLLADAPTLQEVLAKIGDPKAIKGLLLTRVR